MITTKLLIVSTCLAAATAGIQTLRLERTQKAFAEYRLDVAAEDAKGLTKLLEIEHNYAALAKISNGESARKIASARSGAAAAASELDRLRNALSSDSSNSTGDTASSPGANDSSGALREVVGECANAVQAMASAADDAEARLSGLQGYIANVLGNNEKPQ